jgi:hypothetical protein
MLIKSINITCRDYPITKVIHLTNKTIIYCKIVNNTQINSWFIKKKDKNIILHFYTINFSF